jgi:hypothetical protein
MAQRTQRAPRSEAPSRGQGVQHINDDADAEMGGDEVAAEHATAEQRRQYADSQANASETVVATGDEGADALLDDNEREDLGIEEDDPQPSRRELVRMRDMIDRFLGKGGAEPAKPAQPIHVAAGEVQVDDEATKALSFRDAAKAARVKTEHLLSYAVRQARGPDGEPYGPKYLRFVRHDGSKGAVELDD